METQTVRVRRHINREDMTWVCPELENTSNDVIICLAQKWHYFDIN